MSDNQRCEGCDRAAATTYDSEGIPLCDICASLPAVPDAKEEEKYDSLGRIRAAHANTVQGPMERDVVVKELVAACNDALGYFEAILEISAFIGERGAVESKINRLKTAIANARNASSVPEQTKFSSASEFSQTPTSFETGGRNALNLQMAREALEDVVNHANRALDQDHVCWIGQSTFIKVRKALKCLSGNGPKSSDGSGFPKSGSGRSQ